MDLNAKLKDIKLLEEITGKNLCDLEFGKDFLAQSIKKKKKDKTDFMKMKNFCSKEIKDLKERSHNMRGKYSKHLYKSFISRLHTDFQNSVSKPTSPIKKTKFKQVLHHRRSRNGK